MVPECFSGCGTVYSLTPPESPGVAWSEEVLYRFNGASDGYAVYAGVVIGSGGVLYGTTANEGGGSGGIPGGALFSLTPPASAGGAWSESVLRTFAIHGINGAGPDSLILNTTQGVLYGTTVDGGLMGGGTARPTGFSPSLPPLNAYSTVSVQSPPADCGGANENTTPLFAFPPSEVAP